MWCPYTDLHACSLFSWPGHLDKDETESKDEKKKREEKQNLRVERVVTEEEDGWI